MSELWQRALRVLYLFAMTTFAVFAVGFLAVGVVESFGPTDTAIGRALERHDDSGFVTRCSGTGAGGNRCREVWAAKFSVIGETRDGEGWIVVGQGFYDEIRGHIGEELTLQTSTITSRVVAASGDGVDWSVGTVWVWMAGGLCAIGFGCMASYEMARRRGRWDLGAFVAVDFAAVVPAVALGLIGIWYMTFSKTAGLDVEAVGDQLGGFVADPWEYAQVQRQMSDEGAPGDLDRPVAAGSGTLTVVSRAYLGEGPLSMATGSDAVAIPVLMEGGLGYKQRIEFLIVTPSGETIESDTCPAQVDVFQSGFGENHIAYGFVCFDASAMGGELHLVQWFGRVPDGDLTLAYEGRDGIVHGP